MRDWLPKPYPTFEKIPLVPVNELTSTPLCVTENVLTPDAVFPSNPAILDDPLQCELSPRSTKCFEIESEWSSFWKQMSSLPLPEQRVPIPLLEKNEYLTREDIAQESENSEDEQLSSTASRAEFRLTQLRQEDDKATSFTAKGRFEWRNWKGIEMYFETLDNLVQEKWGTNQKLASFSLVCQIFKSLHNCCSFPAYTKLVSYCLKILHKFTYLVHQRLKTCRSESTRRDMAKNWINKIQQISSLSTRLYFQTAFLSIATEGYSVHDLDAYCRRLQQSLRGIGPPLINAYVALYVAYRTALYASERSTLDHSTEIDRSLSVPYEDAPEIDPSTTASMSERDSRTTVIPCSSGVPHAYTSEIEPHVHTVFDESNNRSTHLKIDPICWNSYYITLYGQLLIICLNKSSDCNVSELSPIFEHILTYVESPSLTDEHVYDLLQHYATYGQSNPHLLQGLFRSLSGAILWMYLSGFEKLLHQIIDTSISLETFVECYATFGKQLCLPTHSSSPSKALKLCNYVFKTLKSNSATFPHYVHIINSYLPLLLECCPRPEEDFLLLLQMISTHSTPSIPLEVEQELSTILKTFLESEQCLSLISTGEFHQCLQVLNRRETKQHLLRCLFDHLNTKCTRYADPVLLHALVEFFALVCEVGEDKEDFERLNNFVRKIECGTDVERQLSVYESLRFSCRWTRFSYCLIERTLHLVEKTKQLRNDRHSRRTLQFCKQCFAFVMTLFASVEKNEKETLFYLYQSAYCAQQNGSRVYAELFYERVAEIEKFVPFEMKSNPLEFDLSVEKISREIEQIEPLLDLLRWICSLSIQQNSWNYGCRLDIPFSKFLDQNEISKALQTVMQRLGEIVQHTHCTREQIETAQNVVRQYLQPTKKCKLVVKRLEQLTIEKSL